MCHKESRGRNAACFLYMKKRRFADKILLWAIAGSLSIHFVVALGVHNIPVADGKELSPTHVRIIHIRPPKTPPPTPTPIETPRTQAQPPSKPMAVHPPTQTTKTGPGPVEPPAPSSKPGEGGDGNPNVIGSASPAAPAATPTETPHPACSQPNVQAKAVNPITPPVPDDAAGQTGTAQVQVTLSASGSVEAASIYRSTGSLILDRAAVKAARTSEYTPELRDCVPVRGIYLFTVDFQD